MFSWCFVSTHLKHWGAFNTPDKRVIHIIYMHFLFLHENICCEYSWEVPQLMNTHNIHFYGEIKKKKYQYFSFEKRPYLDSWLEKHIIKSCEWKELLCSNILVKVGFNRGLIFAYFICISGTSPTNARAGTSLCTSEQKKKRRDGRTTKSQSHGLR